MAEQKNPYAAPSAPVADVSRAADDGQLIVGGHAVPSGHGWQWIVDGFKLFKLNPGIWILNLIILVAITFALAFIPFIGQLALNLLFPVFTGGLMIGCHALAHNEPLEVAHLFAGFRDKAGPLILVAVLNLVGAFLIVIVVAALFGFSMFAVMFKGGNTVNPAMVLLMALIMLALFIPLLMAVYFAPALVVFHDLQALDAMKQSFSGCLKNIVPFLVYGIIGLVIGILATIPLGLGWLVWGPTIVGSVYAGYRDIFVQAG
ncbi:MAG TPA: BPSS1780 family membrane protein [Burkholderiales bacterium]|nr:BPSS1780 family membrane protein [Burkholderiales bacterium]